MTVDLLDRPLAVDRVAPVALADDLPRPGRVSRLITLLVVATPLAGLVVGLLSVGGVGLDVLVLAVVLYFLTGFGISIGFHRLLTHKAFVARRPLKIVLAVLGSMACEGGPIEWVANHRRHHAFTDRDGDPHSPQDGRRRLLSGLWHAHVGWLFTATPTSSRRFARDLWRDRDIVAINRLFPLWLVVSLALPFGAGWLLGGDLDTAITSLVWAGLVRVLLLHHVTWSVNSICHVFGRRPFAIGDHSGNVRVLAIASMGESWHNGHHAFPRSARHGLGRSQWDMSARIITWFERLGWASAIQRPSAEAVLARTRGHGRPRDD